MKTDEDVLFGGSGAVGVETAKEMMCELIQNANTDDDLIYNARFQDMRLGSRSPPNQEWQFPTNEELIERPCAHF
jgi:hypothetical protein